VNSNDGNAEAARGTEPPGLAACVFGSSSTWDEIGTAVAQQRL